MMMRRGQNLRWVLAAFVFAGYVLVPYVLTSGLHVFAHPSHSKTPAEPLPKLDFTPPAAGSYKLERIMAVPNGEVLNIDGRAFQLSHFLRDKITLLGFIYTTCSDPDGCPLAYRVFDDLKTKIIAMPTLKNQVRFVTLSFDPGHDTPSVMRSYAGGRARETNSKGLEWNFLTTRSDKELIPLVVGFGQDVRTAWSKTRDNKNSKPVRELSHVLKVFLIDRNAVIREIYTSTFLHPQTVMNDVKTLLMEEGVRFGQ